MVKLIELVFWLCYGGELPERMFWIANTTHTEKPYTEKIASLSLFHRANRVVGRAKHLKGHRYVRAAHLYQHLDALGNRALRRAALHQRQEHSGDGWTTRGSDPVAGRHSPRLDR